MSRVKPYSLHGEPSAETVERIDEMLELLFADLETTANDGLPSGDRGSLLVADATEAFATVTPTTSGTFPRFDGTDTSWAAVSETDITDSTILARVAANETISGLWLHSTYLKLSNAKYLQGVRTDALVGNLIGMDAANKIQVGDSTSNLNLDILFYRGGTLHLTISNSGLTSAVKSLWPDGTVGAPAYAFTNSSDVGFYRLASGVGLGLTTDGVLRTTWRAGAGAPAGSLKHDYAVEWTGEISPAALAAGANDNYAPTNFANARTLRLSGDGGGTSAIGSIAAPTAGRKITLINVSANNITMTNAAGTGTAANRILTATGADVVLAGAGTITLWYDTTTARWRQV